MTTTNNKQNYRYNTLTQRFAPISRGDVFFVTPVDGGKNEIKKERLAVIVSNNDLNVMNGTVQVAYFTTSPKDKKPWNIEIDWYGTKSTIICSQVTTVSLERVSTHVGHVPKGFMRHIDEGIRSALDLQGESEGTLGIYSLQRRNAELEKCLAFAYDMISGDAGESLSFQGMVNYFKEQAQGV